MLFGNLDLIGFQIAASALPITLGLGTSQPIKIPSIKYPIYIPLPCTFVASYITLYNKCMLLSSYNWIIMSSNAGLGYTSSTVTGANGIGLSMLTLGSR